MWIDSGNGLPPTLQSDGGRRWTPRTTAVDVPGTDGRVKLLPLDPFAGGTQTGGPGFYAASPVGCLVTGTNPGDKQYRALPETFMEHPGGLPWPASVVVVQDRA